MVDVTIHVRDSDKELPWLSINGESADLEINTTCYYVKIQRTPVPIEKLKDPNGHTNSLGNFTYKESRYLFQSQVDSDALEHLENIANGFADESGALLYINDNIRMIRHIALNIVKYGRKSVWWEYRTDRSEDAA
jgi:hypothetical protein